MQKIPTIFQRDWAGDKSLVVDKVNPGCEWVLAGGGIATRKLDGTCCLIRGGSLYKRREVKAGAYSPPYFELVGTDPETGKSVGWVPVGLGPEDNWHRDAFFRGTHSDGTYELVGPKIQGNIEGYRDHTLVSHSATQIYPEWDTAPRLFGNLRAWLASMDIEGIVFHHPDGRMAKIKGRDFGFHRRGTVAQFIR